MFGRFLQFYVRRLRVPLVGRYQVVLGDRPGPAGLRSRAMQALSPVPRPRPLSPAQSRFASVALIPPVPSGHARLAHAPLSPPPDREQAKNRILEIPEKNYK